MRSYRNLQGLEYSHQSREGAQGRRSRYCQSDKETKAPRAGEGGLFVEVGFGQIEGPAVLNQFLEDPYAVGRTARLVCDQHFYRVRPCLPNGWERGDYIWNGTNP